MRRLVEFAGDVAQLADQRYDVELRHLVDGLHSELLSLNGDEEDFG
jgi:hypothetical protein